MSLKLSMLGLLVAPSIAFAGVDSFLNKAVLVQNIDQNGSIKNQYLDAFVKDAQGSSFISQSPDMSSFGAF